MNIGPFTSIITDSDTEPQIGHVMVCRQCAEKYNLVAYSHGQGTAPDYVCHGVNCGQQAPLIHIVFDYRPEVLEDLRRVGKRKSCYGAE